MKNKSENSKHLLCICYSYNESCGFTFQDFIKYENPHLDKPYKHLSFVAEVPDGEKKAHTLTNLFVGNMEKEREKVVVTN